MKMMNEVTCKGRSDIWLSCLILGVLLVACIVFLSFPVYAAVFNIASGDVAGLINAINTANSNGQVNTINLAAGTYTLMAVDNNTDGSNGLPSITGNITIKGAGADTTIIERDPNSTTSFRIIHEADTATLTLDGITITGGVIGPTGVPVGGGIINFGGTLDINNCTISHNLAVFGVAGGIANSGKLTINNTIISGNGGDGCLCAGIDNGGPMTITNSIISGNHVGGPDGGDGGICTGGVVTIANSTISGNSAPGGFGGIGNGGTLEIIDSNISFNSANGGGIVNSGTLRIINSTIADNAGNATFAPGSFCTGGITNSNGGVVSITNSTIANNSVDDFTNSCGESSGGILNDAGSTVQLQNTILALNTILENSSLVTNSDCSGEVSTLGNNIIGDTTGCTITLQSTDLTGDPSLGTFTDNGTPGNGHFPLLPNSRAIDAGNNDVCLANPILATDQIGDPRVGICDIGSIEFEPFKNLGQCISTLIQQNCSGLQGQNRAACIKEQQTVCSNLFEGK